MKCVRRYLVLVIFCKQKDFLCLFQQTFLRCYQTKKPADIFFNSRLKWILRRNLEYFALPNYKGVVIAGVDWWNISKAIKRGTVFLGSGSYKNQTQKKERESEICPELEFNTPIHSYLQLGKGKNFIWLMYFPILLQGNFCNWKNLFLWAGGILSNCILFIIFLQVFFKIYFSENPLIIKPLDWFALEIDLPVFMRQWLILTGFLNNYHLSYQKFRHAK